MTSREVQVQAGGVMISRSLSVSASLLVAACTLVSADITESRNVQEAGWSKDVVYQAALPLFLLYDSELKQYAICRSNSAHLPSSLGYQWGHFQLPRNLEQYEAQPERWPEIVRILPAGTRIRFEQAYRFGALDWDLAALHINATVLENPPLSVNLACMSTPDNKGRLWLRDTKWLV